MNIRALALVLAVLSTPAGAQQTPAAARATAPGPEPDLASRIDLTGFPVYADPGGRFTLVYPAEWTETDPTGDACFFAGFVRFYETGPPDAALLTVTCNPSARLAGDDTTDVARALGIDTDAGFRAFAASVEEQTGDDVEPLTRSPAVLGGRPAFRWTYRQRIAADDGVITLRTLQHVVIVGGTQYGVGCSASEDLWEQAQHLCEALSRTFSVDSESAQP